MTRQAATPHLRIYECEGRGRFFTVYDRGEFAGEFGTGEAVCTAYAGRIALVYGYDAYDRACAAVIAADPQGWDTSDVQPDPMLCIVRSPAEVRA